MAKKKVRFTVFDFIIVLIVVVLCLSTVIRNVNIKEFNSENVYKNTVVTLSVKGIKRENFSCFHLGDSVYSSDRSSFGKIGNIKNLRSTPSIKTIENDSGFNMIPDFGKIDLLMDVSAECLVDGNGFCSINSNYIAPSLAFSADNGRIVFDCEVVSVKFLD